MVMESGRGKLLDYRVSLNQSCFPGLSTARFVEIAAAVGADAVDLNVLQHAEPVAEVAAAVRSGSLPVGAVHALMDWALPDDPDPRSALEARLEMAVAAGASIVVCVAPVRRGELPDHDDVMRSAAERLARLAEVARGAGVRLALEPVGRSSTRPGAQSGIRRTQDALRIAEEAGEDVTLAIDSYNLATADESFDEIRLIPSARLGAAHIADADGAHDMRVLPGLGSIDLGHFVRALGESGYDGTLSLELFPAAPWSDPLTFARQAVAAVQGYI